jgi:multiple sugar transport system permease protein
MAVRTAVSVGGRTQSWWRRSEVPSAIGFLSPALLALAATLAYPLGYAFWLSLNETNLAGRDWHFVGLENYSHALHDPLFLASLGRTVYFGSLVLVGTVGLGLAFALILNADFPGRSVVRALMIVPWSMSSVLVALTFGWIFNPNFGYLDGLLLELGVGHPVDWFSSGWRILSFMALATVWTAAPFAALLYLGALQNVPVDLMNAAKVDGAGPVDRFRHVTLPWIRTTTFVVAAIATLSGFSVFALVLVLTGGGPGYDTTVLPWWGYTVSFYDFNWGEGAAIFFIIGILTLLLTIAWYLLFAYRRHAST